MFRVIRGLSMTAIEFTEEWFESEPLKAAIGGLAIHGVTLGTMSAGGVTNDAIAGNRIAYTTKYGQTTRVLALSAIACQEWVVARPASGGAPVAALAGDGNVLAYALKGVPDRRHLYTAAG